MSKFDFKGILTQNNQVKELPIDILVPYHNHQFKLYSGERLEDMVESVKQNGILNPILVQPIDNGCKYEILSGHNRVQSAKLVGLEYIPAIVKENLSEDEAQMYVIETNLMQRGFNDLLISEQAHVLKIQHSKMFSQGKRNDIIAELERLESGATSSQIGKKLNKKDDSTSSPLGNKLNGKDDSTSSQFEKKLKGKDDSTSSQFEKKLKGKDDSTSSQFEKKLNEKDDSTSSQIGKKLIGNTSLDKVGNEYGMSRPTVARLLRINYLIQPFKDMIDSKKMPIMVGVELSYISENVQTMIFEIISNNNKKIDMKLSKAIRKLCNEDNSVTMETIESLIVGEKQSNDTKPIKIQLSQEFCSKYFDKKTSKDEVINTIQKALDMYFKSLNE